jgi:hypothetical protein
MDRVGFEHVAASRARAPEFDDEEDRDDDKDDRQAFCLASLRRGESNGLVVVMSGIVVMLVRVVSMIVVVLVRVIMVMIAVMIMVVVVRVIFRHRPL